MPPPPRALRPRSWPPPAVLLRAGERPTVEKIRQHLGQGSPKLHRIPEAVAQIAETLWLTALEEARTRAGLEQRRKTHDLERDRRETDVRRHLLSLRESEFEDRLKERGRTIAMLEEQLSALTRLMQQEQATRTSAERRIAAQETALQDNEARTTRLLSRLSGRVTTRGRPRAVKTPIRPARPRPPQRKKPPRRSKQRMSKRR